ncbi:MAG: cysteine dioxygenase family protein [Bacteroidota bacterium]
MNHISTLPQLIDHLDNADPYDIKKVIKKIKLQASELESFATWKKGCYTRNCLGRTQAYELILLCWAIDAKTPIHGHGGKDCWVYQVQGTLDEVRFEQNDNNELIEKRRISLTPGRLTYMHDRMGYHAIENISGQRAMTLHIYASPIDACKVYNASKDCFETKEMSYDTYKEVGVEPYIP